MPHKPAFKNFTVPSIKNIKIQIRDLKKQIPYLKKKLKERIIEEIRERLPTEPEIKAFFIEQIYKRGIPIACSVKGQEITEDMYNGFKDITELVSVKGNAAKSELSKITEKAQNIEVIITTVEDYISVIDPIIDILKAVFQGIEIAFSALFSADVGITPGLLTILRAITIAYDIVHEITTKLVGLLQPIDSVVSFLRRVLKRITGALGTLINAVNKVLEYINFIDTLVEAAYLMYLNICNGYPPSEDEAPISSDLLDEFVSNEGQKFGDDYYNQTILDLQNLGKDEVIQKIYDANFVQIGYNRFKPGTSFIPPTGKEGGRLKSRSSRGPRSNYTTRSGMGGNNMGGSSGGTSGGGTSGGGGGGGY